MVVGPVMRARGDWRGGEPEVGLGQEEDQLRDDSIELGLLLSLIRQQINGQ